MANITQAQKLIIEDLDSFAGEYQLLNTDGISQVLVKYAEKFKDNLIININKKQVVASGDMERSIEFKLREEGSKKVIDVYMNFYAKFVDKGVKGVRSSKNAPSSPYQYKNYGMSADGRASIKKYIESGRAKITTSDVGKYGAVGSEKKKLSLIDVQTNKLIYLIKKYGIKTTNFLSDSIDQSFDGLENELLNIL
jgi:hypothetical protein